MSGVRPVLYDLYSGGGGACRGYQLAGFEVWGADIKPQARYPGERFVQADALDFVRAVMAGEYPMPDAWHASPPCQHWSAYRRKGHGVGDGYPDLIAATREALRATGRPYVIENVPGAPLDAPVLLCGSMFGLDVRRHRLFEASMPLPPMACRHETQREQRFACATNRTNLRSTVEIGVWRIPLDVQQQAMGGLDWMTREELSQAVPPAYTQWVGAGLMVVLRAALQEAV